MARTARAGAAVAPRPVRRRRARVAAPKAVPRKVRARGESVLDALLRGPAWIAVVGALLAGIVFFNVDLLRLNRSIAMTSEKSEAVSRENARLRNELARLGSSERVQKAALQRGLVLPAPGDVRFRTISGRDDKRALANLKGGGKAQAATPREPGAGAGRAADRDHSAGPDAGDHAAARDPPGAGAPGSRGRAARSPDPDRGATGDRGPRDRLRACGSSSAASVSSSRSSWPSSP